MYLYLIVFFLKAQQYMKTIVIIQLVNGTKIISYSNKMISFGLNMPSMTHIKKQGHLTKRVRQILESLARMHGKQYIASILNMPFPNERAKGTA